MTTPLDTKTLNRGLRALDAVKHCEDEMLPHQRDHDYKMRHIIPPNHWTLEDVEQMVKTARRVNRAPRKQQ